MSSKRAPFNPRPFVEHYKEQNRQELMVIGQRAEAARHEARALAERILQEDAEVRAVILFGSLAEGEPRRLDFDIDLALDGGDVFKALDAVEGSTFRVDIVRLDKVPQHLRSRITERGVLLVHRQP